MSGAILQENYIIVPICPASIDCARHQLNLRILRQSVLLYAIALRPTVPGPPRCALTFARLTPAALASADFGFDPWTSLPLCSWAGII
jgi:hypothetical protein